MYIDKKINRKLGRIQKIESWRIERYIGDRKFLDKRIDVKNIYV